MEKWLEAVKMEKRIKLWIVIGAMFAIALFLTFKASTVDSGTIQAVTNTASSASSGMVGGC